MFQGLPRRPRSCCDHPPTSAGGKRSLHRGRESQYISSVDVNQVVAVDRAPGKGTHRRGCDTLCRKPAAQPLGNGVAQFGVDITVIMNHVVGLPSEKHLRGSAPQRVQPTVLEAGRPPELRRPASLAASFCDVRHNFTARAATSQARHSPVAGGAGSSGHARASAPDRLTVASATPDRHRSTTQSRRIGEDAAGPDAAPLPGAGAAPRPAPIPSAARTGSSAGKVRPVTGLLGRDDPH